MILTLSGHHVVKLFVENIRVEKTFSCDSLNNLWAIAQEVKTLLLFYKTFIGYDILDK